MNLIENILFKINLAIHGASKDKVILKKIEQLDKEISDKKSRMKYADLLTNTPDYVHYKKPKSNTEKGKRVNFGIEISKEEIKELENQRNYYRSLLLDSSTKKHDVS